MPAKLTANFYNGRVRQRGAILIILLVLIVVGMAAILVNSLTATAAKNARQQNTADALAQAKAALIGYAITYGDTHSGQVPGYLPCPDTDGNNGLQSEGIGEYGTSSCNSNPSSNQNVSVIGRLPWKTLDLSTYRDGDGECLWYAVSGTYKNNPPTGLMNWDTAGQFQVYAADGTLLASQVVAVIFAPGAPISGQSQNRTPDGSAPICGGNYTVANYLDAGTVNSVNFNNANIASGNFIQGTSGGSINDQMVFITRQDIWNAVQNRTDFKSTNLSINPLKMLTYQVALCLARYGQYNSAGGGYTGGGWTWYNGNDSLPWPAPLLLSDYSVNSQYDDSTNLYAGRVPYSVGNSSMKSGNAYSNLMSPGNCSYSWASVDPWWNNWKDHLFYALAQEYKPSDYTIGQSCGPCLSINGSGQYAAVVMFANSRLAGQVRASDTTGVNSTPRATVSNYLEDVNASNFTGASGDENYKTASTGINDILCYINNQTLSVTCP